MIAGQYHCPLGLEPDAGLCRALYRVKLFAMSRSEALLELGGGGHVPSPSPGDGAALCDRQPDWSQTLGVRK